MLKATQPYNLLVIEDNPGDFLLLQQYLIRSQLPIGKITHADRMAQVPGLVNENKFDIALLDLSLPDSQGVDSVIALDHLMPQDPIVVFSGMSTLEIAIETISLGAQDYLIKGEFDEKMLAKTIQYSMERKRTMEKLLESNERFQFVNKATHDTIWEWNYATRQGVWGEGFSKTFGYPAEKQQYDEFWIEEYIHPEDRQRVIQKIQYHINSGLERWQDEYRFLNFDGTYKDVFDRGYILYDIQKKPYRMIGAMTDLTEKKKLEAELADQQLKQQKLITEVTIQAQEKERDELGRELHDNINQILATVKMYIGMIRDKETVPKDLISQCHVLISETMAEIRKLSHSLVSPSLGDIGLGEAILELAREINMTNKIQVELISNLPKDDAMDSRLELMLYRVVQEQINNILKYAEAKKVIISLKKIADVFYLSILDDGIGFDVAKAVKGIGLKNIRNRVEYYSGSMNIISSPGNGCNIDISIPITKS
ncbi:MAG: PAS domain-containing protein [Chitinophagaceae bacterium]|nr:PAS domain-containing protein [Chitinophagaceae bacterium]